MASIGEEEWSTNLDAEVSTINIVSQEQISRLGWIATDLKELHQVIVLAVHVATNRNWRIHF